jgi:hypothetical protein
MKTDSVVLKVLCVKRQADMTIGTLLQLFVENAPKDA